jgi:hypothetical protein
MSSGSQHKMYSYELAPPPAVWEKIAAELDALEMTSPFTKKLKNIEIAPPPQAWYSIVSMLDASSMVNLYRKRLEKLEVAPPAAAWNKIRHSLDEMEQETVPERRRIIPWVRYAAAAALIAFLAWGGTMLFRNNSPATQSDVAKEDNKAPVINPVPVENKAPVPADSIAIEAIALQEEARNDAALEASKKTFARMDVPESKIRNAADFFFMPETEEPGTRGIDYETLDLEPINKANRYIVFMTPEGNIIRMSKKLGDLVCCVSGEVEEKDCVDQMNKWREKIAYTPAGHSPGNFMEVLNLVNSLQEDQ